MANTIKIGNLDISAFKVGSDDCKVYLGDTLLYPQGQPAFQGKWKATYQDSHVESAECDSTSAITSGEITKSDLVSLEIGDCVTSIGDSAFQNCTGLTSISIPSSVTSIGVAAFQNCSSLSSVTIPNSVTNIANYAFRYCTTLLSITINNTTPPTLGGSGVFNSTNNCPIYVPSESVSTYQSASGWSKWASRILAIPNS